MTAAQKKNAEKFKKAVAEAKKLRKKNPKLTHPQAVKQAFAILYKTGKVSGAKKTATKKPARKKATAKSYHKDNKSHNVRISVVSGLTVGQSKMLKMWERVYGDYAQSYISSKSVKDRKIISKEMQKVKKVISEIKKLK